MCLVCLDNWHTVKALIQGYTEELNTSLAKWLEDQLRYQIFITGLSDE